MQEQEQQPQQSQRPRILIADDSEFNREYLRAILEDDYDIMEVPDGPEAIETMEREGSAISLLLLDIHMVTMDGFGASGPAPVLFEHFGFSVENVVRVARGLF